MGILDDLLFSSSSSKPKITKEEWKKVRSNLIGSHNFTTKELEEIEEVFRGDIDEPRDIDKGIDSEELVKGIQYMRQHINLHHISLAKIDILEIEMMKYIGSSSSY
ncbi:MAG: hypothetical protein WC933_03345 [Candidatus Paceibacterota bacterium]|jgi:hypothetical protein